MCWFYLGIGDIDIRDLVFGFLGVRVDVSFRFCFFIIGVGFGVVYDFSF